MTRQNDYLGSGIYSAPEAARLVGISQARVRRWLAGYTYSRGTRASGPLWKGDYHPIGTSMALSFLDLMELRVVAAFLKHGVAWPELRQAHKQARGLIRSPHPFSTAAFHTDGSHVFADLPMIRDEEGLLEVVGGQYEFEALVRPLFKEIDFSENSVPILWWPRGRSRSVVLDPTRQFGAPILHQQGVPTRPLARLVAAGEAVKTVAQWYDIPSKVVREAVAFEKSLAA